MYFVRAKFIFFAPLSILAKAAHFLRVSWAEGRRMAELVWAWSFQRSWRRVVQPPKKM